MSDSSYDLAILIIVSITLFLVVVYILWRIFYTKGCGHDIWAADENHRFMTDRNLFRKKEKDE